MLLTMSKKVEEFEEALQAEQVRGFGILTVARNTVQMLKQRLWSRWRMSRVPPGNKQTPQLSASSTCVPWEVEGHTGDDFLNVEMQL